jgi:hypothetical protein
MLGRRDQVAVAGNIGACRAFQDAAIPAPIAVSECRRHVSGDAR